MQLKRIFCLLFLLCSVVGLAFSQDKSSKEKNKKSEQKTVEIKANVAVLDSTGKFADDIKLQDLKVFEDGVEQKLTYFTKKEPVLNLGLVVDNSGSMRKNLDNITIAASTFVNDLRANDEAFVIRFVDSSKIEIMQEWTSSKKDLKEAVENMFIDGGQSAVFDAVYLSAEKILERERKNKSNRYAVVLVSDAEERDSFYNYDKLISLFQGSDLQIFLISFAENAPMAKKKARSVSHLLTLETGGTVISLPKKHSKEDIINAFKNIAGELRSQYIVSYTSTNQKRDGLPRKLSVEVADGANGLKRQAIIRESFIVPKD